MKRFILLFSLAMALVVTSTAFAQDDGKGAKEETLRKSVLFEPPSPTFAPDGSSYPQPFNETTGDPIVNQKGQTAISTGYYFVDSDDPVGEPWHPQPSYIDTNTEPANWRRVISGPAQWAISEARQDVGDDGRPKDGYRFFHNPNQDVQAVYDEGDYDSTDNAIAGPIPIGFDFYVGGLRYDSFYVSTNGCIGLVNRRYKYDLSGNRDIPENFNDCYDPMSMDWFKIARETSGAGGHDDGLLDGMDDDQADNYGFTLFWDAMTSVPGGTHFGGFGGVPGAFIAPFWGEGHLSQFNEDTEEPEDFGKVYYYRNTAGNKLVIFFVNFALKGSLAYMWPSTNSYTQSMNARPADAAYCGASCQVTLDRTDSSITINYLEFKGKYNNGLYRNDARDLFRWNSYAGIYCAVRHTDYNSKTQSGVAESNLNYPWHTEDRAYTTYFAKYMSREEDFPKNQQAVKYKQWKNTVRYVDIQYRVRNKEKVDGEYSDEYTEEVKTTEANNYELLAGHRQIGQIQPVVLVQNLTNDIQGPDGVNFQSQDLEFKVRMTIKNLALQKSVYNKAVKVDSNNIANRAGDLPFTKVILSDVTYSSNNYEADNESLYTNNGTDEDPDWVLNDIRLNGVDYAVNGVPPYYFVQVYFPPFEPNENFPDQIGRMRAYLMCEPRNPYTGGSLKDMWPFDDTTSVRFFVMRRILATETFTDDVTEWHQIPEEGAMPSVTKWVNIGCSVVPGEEVSRHPLPPRGSFQCDNEEVFPNTKISSPTIRLFRPSSVPMGSWGGTVLRSFPIDIRKKNGARLSLSIQRNLNPEGTDWTRQWSDQTWTAVEHRIVKDNWYNQQQAPDELRVEYALPSPDMVQGIANIDLYDVPEVTDIQPSVGKSDRWRYHQRRGGAKAEENMSAFSLFGGGGYMIGFAATDDPAAPDSALLPPNYTGKVPHGLKYDYFDDGIDYKFTRYNIPIPDTIVNAPADGAMNFRFRIQAYCCNNQQPQKIADDDDNFYIDNIRIVHSDKEDVDLEMTAVSVNWPYTQMPASQAIRMPVELELANNTSVNSPSFWVRVRICELNTFMQGDTAGSTIYCRTKPVTTLRAGQTVFLEMPDWDAAKNPPGNYRLIANVFVPGGADLESSNDTTYFDYEIKFSDVLAYDPPNNASNSVDGYPGAKSGRGLTTYGHSKGGTDGGYEAMWGFGAESGDGSGQIAMKFKLDQADTIKGYQAYFCPLSMAPDEVAYVMYEGGEYEDTPRAKIDSTEVISVRGYDDIDNEYKWNEYVNVLLPEPIILPAGTYWVAVSQLGETGLELGASESRCAMRITNYYRHDLFPSDVEMNGSASIHLMVDKSFRIRNTNGDMLNYNVFAFENTKESGNWEPFMPTSDNPGYAHLNYRGVISDGTITHARGTWIPFIRPYLGERVHGEVLDIVACDNIPVELVTFKGYPIDKNIELSWETASEENNYGFYVERRVAEDQKSEWASVGFVAGNGTTKEFQRYTFTDDKVASNVKYQYRLNQVDAQGHSQCGSYSQVIEVSVADNGFALEQNIPNPVKNSTTIKYYVPSNGSVKIEIVDIFGNHVKTLVDANYLAGSYDVNWDCRDEDNNRLSTGTYIYRMTFDGKVLTRKMQIVR